MGEPGAVCRAARRRPDPCDAWVRRSWSRRGADSRRAPARGCRAADRLAAGRRSELRAGPGLPWGSGGAPSETAAAKGRSIEAESRFRAIAAGFDARSARAAAAARRWLGAAVASRVVSV